MQKTINQNRVKRKSIPLFIMLIITLTFKANAQKLVFSFENSLSSDGGKYVAEGNGNFLIPGYFGSGWYLNGINNRLLLKSDAINPGLSNFTISMRVKFNKISNQVILSKRFDGYTNSRIVWPYIFSLKADGSIQFFVRDASNHSINGYKVDSYPCVVTNLWYTITGVRRGTIIELYINGILVGFSNTGGKVLDLANSQYTYIGSSTSDKRYLSGEIDELQYWEKTLSKKEIVALAIH